VSYTLAFALKLRIKHGKPSVRVADGEEGDGIGENLIIIATGIKET
jgi:hypothetical protein